MANNTAAGDWRGDVARILEIKLRSGGAVVASPMSAGQVRLRTTGRFARVCVSKRQEFPENNCAHRYGVARRGQTRISGRPKRRGNAERP